METLENKIDFAVIIRATKANPNGDPLNGNRPRMDYDGYGEISDVCIKRKIRDRLMESKDEQGNYKYSVFVQSDERKTDDAKSLKDRADKALKDHLSLETACSQWFDVRAFGQVFAFKSDKSKKKKETSCLQPLFRQRSSSGNRNYLPTSKCGKRPKKPGSGRKSGKQFTDTLKKENCQQSGAKRKKRPRYFPEFSRQQGCWNPAHSRRLNLLFLTC